MMTNLHASILLSLFLIQVINVPQGFGQATYDGNGVLGMDVTSVSITIPAGDNRLLVVHGARNGSGSAPTADFASMPMTNQVSLTNSDGDLSVIFTLSLGSGGAMSGTATFTSGSTFQALWAGSFHGVDQTTPVPDVGSIGGTASSGSAETITIPGLMTNDSEDILFDGIMITNVSGSHIGGGSRVANASFDGGFANICARFRRAVGGMEDMSWSVTASDYAYAAIIIQGVAGPPTFSKAFVPTSIASGGSSNLTFTIDNASSQSSVSDLDFTNNLPAGLVVASPANASTTCTGGTLTASAGSGVISYTGGMVSASSTCLVQVDVTSNLIGSYPNTTGDLTSDLGNSGTASATLSVEPPPLFAKNFSPNPIAVGGVSTLTFTIDNSASAIEASALDFTDNLPPGVTVATPANGSTTCTGGTLTATPGSGTINYVGGTIPAGATCTIQVDVTSSTAGSHNSTSGDLTSNLGNSGTASASLTVEPPPTFTKAFAPNPIAIGGTSTLIFTIDNSASALAVTNLDFSDNLPAAVLVATPSNASTTCTGGTLTAVDGTGVVTYTGGSIDAGTSCTIQVDVTSSTPGSHVNTSGDLTSSGGNSGPASAILTVNPPPGFSKSFAPDPSIIGGISTLTFTIDNTSSTAAGTALDFTDNLPASLVVATPPNAATTCTGGTLTASSGTGAVSYTGGTVAASSSCTVTVDIASSTAGMHVNTSGDLTSSLGNSGTASDVLTINPPPTFVKTFDADTILHSGLSTLSFTIDNTGSTVDATAVDFMDNLPTGVVVANPANATTSCVGGTLTAVPGSGVISYTGGTALNASSCIIQVDVTNANFPALPEEIYTNITGDLTSNLGNSGTATDDLLVVAPSSIHGFLFEDVDSNGTYEVGVDWPLEGAQVTLIGIDAGGNSISSNEVSNVDGYFWFTNLFGGGSAMATVTITPPPGFNPSTATSLTTALDAGAAYVSEPGQAMLPPGGGQFEVDLGNVLAFGVNRIGGADCTPNCRDINASLDANGDLMIRLSDLLSNYIACAAGVEVTIQTEFGATVFGPAFITAADLISLDGCLYRGRKLKAIIRSDNGTCWSEITVKQSNLPVLGGESHNAWCFDSIVSDPNAYLNFIGGKMAFVPCQNEVVQAQFVADWIQFPQGDTCGNDTVKVIYREFEAFDKLGRRGVAVDTITVFRLPQLTNESLFCLESSTIYCNDLTSFNGPLVIVGNASLGSTEINLIEVENDNGDLTFLPAEIGDKCGMQVHVDQWKFAENCEDQYKVVIELKQSCPGGMSNVSLTPGATLTVGGPPIPPNVWVPLTADYTYWRCEFWVTNLDTLPPVVTPKAEDWITIYTSEHDCAAHALVPSVYVSDDWSGVKQVKAVIENVGTTILSYNTEDSCWQSSTQFKLPKSEVPFRVLYEAYDSCHNIGYDSVFIKIKDNVRSVAVVDKGLTVSLSDKKVWIDAEDFDEGSWDNCGVNMILARRVDWTDACVDMCYNSPDSTCHPESLEEACFPIWNDEHDTIWCLNLEDDKHCDEVEAHYSKMLEWWKKDGQACGALMHNSWQYDLMKFATVDCKGSMDTKTFDKAFRRALQKGIEGFYHSGSAVTTDLHRYDLTTKSNSTLAANRFIYRMVKNGLDDKIYHTAANGRQLLRMDLDGNNLEILQTHAENTWGIAIDEQEQQIYYSTTSAIHRYDILSQTRTTLAATGLSNVFAIDLDHKRKQVYFSNRDSNRIERMGFDGSNREIIVEGKLVPDGMALDLGASKIYWADAKYYHIGRANLDGSHRETLLEVPSNAQLTDLRLDARQQLIYFSETESVFLDETTSFLVSRVYKMPMDGGDREEVIREDVFGILLCHDEQEVREKFLCETASIEPFTNEGRAATLANPSIGFSNSDFNAMIDNWKNIGGGWSDAVPFSCEDACGPVTVEILVMDYWCNWSKAWTKVWVEDKTPVTVAKDVIDEETISCKTYKDKRYAYPDVVHPVALDYVVEKAKLGEQNAFDLLDEVFGGYCKAWMDPYGKYVDSEGAEIDCDITFYDSICDCSTYNDQVRVYDEHLGYIWKDSVVTECFYEQDTVDFQKGIVVVNCEENVHCEQEVWCEFDHCGQGYIFRKFKIWQGCPDSFYIEHNVADSLRHATDTIYRHQRIWVGNECELNKYMFEVPYDTTVYSCAIDYDGAGNVIGDAGPENTGIATYKFDDDCRIVSIGHQDKVFKVVGGEEACYKILRTWYFADWCGTGGTPLDGAWWYDRTLVIDSCVQKIVVIDTMPPVCTITGPVEDGGFIEVGACAFDLTVDVAATDPCGLTRYYWELKDITDPENTSLVDDGSGELVGNEATFEISSNDLPHATYKLKVVAVDECNNEGYCEYLFDVVSVKKPSPVCVTSVTARLTPWDNDGDGTPDTAKAVVWAGEFDASSTPACQDTAVEFRIEFLTGDSTDLSAAGDADSLALGCGDEGTHLVRLWVVSLPSDTRDYCDVVLIVQSDGTGCDNVVGEREPLSEVSNMQDAVDEVNRLPSPGEPVEPGVGGRPITSGSWETGYVLHQNIPNPFTEETAIGFVLPQAESATISVYDVTGRLIRSIEGDFVKGFNQVQFRKADLGVSGILYYRLNAGTFTSTRKMVVME